MLQQLRALTERASASAARVVDGGASMLGFTATGITTFAWNVKPSVHPTAICTHGNKRYEWRLQERLT